jgi:hypothetical protein
MWTCDRPSRSACEHPCVAKAEVYHTMDGVLHVRVQQREPIVRVFNSRW